MKRSETTNTFNEGLVMDINPLVTPNNVLCNALNATLVTMNGNENALQNDMGNGRVETAFLPEGYVPLGTAELGGIIYVVSYNPLIDKCQIGSFPSPERNITSSEIQAPQVSVTNSQFQNTSGNERGKLINTILKVKLLSDPNANDGLFKLNPGDKYTIYSTNQGITNNADCISDVGNPLHQVDTVPRNVTIHVVSIGDDGKVVYLDDSLKWSDGNDTPPDYYIRECDGDSAIETDIDKYRTLVSSAYNIFNSKVSGELALLFELKIIDSFSVTWDAEVNTIGESSSGTNDKEAIVTFNVNYTSDHTDINLKHIILTDSEVTGGLECPVSTGNYCTLSDSDTSGRVNDGTDPDIAVTVGSFKYKSGENLSDYVWNYQLTPAMTFGYLDYLAQRGSINFSEIGSGKTEFDEWRYFIQDSNFYLNWGLSAYPEKNKKIEKVVMTFIPFDKVSAESVIIDNTIPPSNSYPQYTITGKNSYSGYFQELINFGESSKVSNGVIDKDYLYLVDVCIQYGKEGDWEYRHNYKWLYTTGQWNQVFIDGVVTDFNEELNLDDVLKFESEFTTKDNIDIYKSTYDSTIRFPKTFEKEDQPYVVMGAQVTTVNYQQEEESDGTFNEETASISSDVKTNCTSYPTLFKFEKQKADTYEFGLKKTFITHDEFKPTSDKASSLADYVIPKVAEPDEKTNQVSIASDFGTTVKTVIDKGIENKEIDDKAIDSFSSTIKWDEAHVDINVRGAIFARINADLDIKQVQIEQEIKPLLCYNTDYTRMGLESSSKFADLFIESHRDLGGGDPFGFKFSNRSGNQNYESSKDDWNPGDTFDAKNWWDIPPYVNYLNSWMIAADGSIQCMRWDGGKNTFWGSNRTSIQGQYGLWIRTDEDRYIPIYTFRNSEAELAKLVAMLYVSLYYVDTTTQYKNLAVVTNVNYMTQYSETWNLLINTQLKVNNIHDSVVLITSEDKEKYVSLQELQDICKGILKDGEEVININNISRTPIETLEIPDYSIAHTFLIRNIDLYQMYDDARSNVLPAIATVITEKDWVQCDPKTPGMLYVYNATSKEFVKVSKDVSKWLYEDGTLTEIPSDLGDEVKRLYLENGVYHTVRVGATCPPLAAFSINGDNILEVDESKILESKVQMILETDTKGHTYSYVRNNSGYSLPNIYSSRR